MIRSLGLALALAAVAVPASAQTPPATVGDRYVPSPWWMRDPVIAMVGRVRVELPANRASFNASFQSVERTAAEASRKAGDQVRALSQALGAYGVEKVQVETTLTTQPLYDQYRGDDGVVRDNARADKIERYQSVATVSLSVRDTGLLERIYATVLASKPTSVSQVFFNLQPDNATLTRLAGEAVKDAARRARAAAEDAGATLGRAKVIDPTGRACETDVLAGWPSYSSGGAGEQATTVSADMVASPRMMAAPAPPPPPPPPPGGGAPSEAQIEAARVALQPPIRELSDSACVVYGLN